MLRIRAAGVSTHLNCRTAILPIVDTHPGAAAIDRADRIPRLATFPVLGADAKTARAITADRLSRYATGRSAERGLPSGQQQLVPQGTWLPGHCGRGVGVGRRWASMGAGSRTTAPMAAASPRPKSPLIARRRLMPVASDFTRELNRRSSTNRPAERKRIVEVHSGNSAGGIIAFIRNRAGASSSPAAMNSALTGPQAS
jgi:hypothetical protein